ncbi:hypothetical protein HG1285_14304 [Hydrogenivirga sp. 128-5-R1-1]|nr:hypothetical protein HG1285_14304 [Hydrogenivirga sp. 128-5-R1-1]
MFSSALGLPTGRLSEGSTDAFLGNPSPCVGVSRASVL